MLGTDFCSFEVAGGGGFSESYMITCGILAALTILSIDSRKDAINVLFR